MPLVAARPAGFQNAASTPSPTEANAPPSAEARAPAGTSRNAKREGAESAPAGRAATAMSRAMRNNRAEPFARAARQTLMNAQGSRMRDETADGAGGTGPVGRDVSRTAARKCSTAPVSVSPPPPAAAFLTRRIVLRPFAVARRLTRSAFLARRLDAGWALGRPPGALAVVARTRFARR